MSDGPKPERADVTGFCNQNHLRDQLVISRIEREH